MLRHADGGEAIDPHSEAHFHIRPGGAAQGIHGFVLMLGFAALFGEHEKKVFVPCYFVGLHPESVHARFMLRQLFLVLRIGFGRAHQKLARGDRNHVVGNGSKGNGDLVRSRLLRVFLAGTDFT